MAYSLGVDIGGTKIAAAIIDEEGNCSSRTECPSSKTDREALFRRVVDCMENTLRKASLSIHDIVGLGMGVPGKVDCENGVALFQNNIPWGNFPLVRRIKEYFPVEKVVIDNDVYMAAFAEWVIRGKAQKETFVYLTISTGISCCTIHHGEFIRGAGFAGEIGFLPVKEEPGSGQFQRLESVASGFGIVKAAVHLMKDGNTNNITTAQVIESYKKGDELAANVMQDIFASYAKGIYPISCLLDPDCLILGGGVINHHPDLLEPIQAALEKYLVPDQKDFLSRMDVSRFQGDSGLIGAGLRVYDF